MHAITLLGFLLMIQNVCLDIERQSITGDSGYPSHSECSYEEVIKNEVMKWNSGEKFKVFTPKRSCVICVIPKCRKKPCETTFNVTKINIYNNLFEFGLLAFRMAKTNIFKIMINDMCYFKVEILPKRTEGREIEIYFFECLNDVLNANDDKCSEKLVKKTTKSFNISRDCIFVGLAFVMPKVLHYSITFNCTDIPGLLLSQKTSIKITSNKCFIDKENKNLTAQFIYAYTNIIKEKGMIVMLPCTTGGFSFDEQKGEIKKDKTCEIFMSNDTHIEGTEFHNKKVSNDKPSNSTPTSDKPKSEVEMKKILKNLTAASKKALQGCKLVDDPKKAKVPTGSAKVPTGLTHPPPADDKNKDVKTGDEETKKTPKKIKSTTKKQKIIGLDASRGSLNFLSIKLKIIMLASNFGIIYHF